MKNQSSSEEDSDVESDSKSARSSVRFAGEEEANKTGALAESKDKEDSKSDDELNDT